MPSSRSERPTASREAALESMARIREHWIAAMDGMEDDEDGSATRAAIEAAGEDFARLDGIRELAFDAELARAVTELTELYAQLKRGLAARLEETRTSLVEIPRRKQTLGAYAKPASSQAHLGDA